ncbi:helix-turn-helix domain-containing protein [Clostridium perfringens]|uniref:Helix-turn-helix transcriptional regulator n=1 Tax=Clostridium perfringens TaxID=1502 RepID=A0AAP4EH36_CLOPF|nr:helix-turn-helix transcriptional regulator [Clostridium perfringens]MDH2337506.1 helix-turn-helix transcriptional regulator [Clostridium perfringens]
MIRCNLAILLAERNLKITKVSKDTGVSRTTLTSLSNNYSQGVQFDTINTLCKYLKVTPEQLISYIPVDITLDKIDFNNENITIDLTVDKDNKSNKYSISGNFVFTFSYSYPEIDYISISLNLIKPFDNKGYETLIEAFKSLPITFLKDIENKIFSKVISSFGDTSISNSLIWSFKWPDEFNL